MNLLPDIPVPDDFAKPRGADEPLFWIQEIRFLRSWKNGVTDEIRRISFKKGLNVIWSPPPEVDTAEQRISGHASGKTTLCRLIRYMFDEPKMGNDDFRRSVNDRFPEGCIVAQVRLNGESWCLARPFTQLTMPGGRSARCESIEKFLQGEMAYGTYADFRKELEKSAKSIVHVDMLPSGERLTWRHFFPWFTRDQECHFAKIHDWRLNTTSETDSPLLNQTEKAIVMRSVYEPNIFKEVNLSARQSQLNASVKSLTRQADIYEQICRERLAKINAHKMVDLPEVDSELFVEMAKKRLESEIEKARQNPPDVQEEIDRLTQNKLDADQHYQNLAAAYNATVEHVNALALEVKELRKESKVLEKKEDELPPLSRVKLISQSMPDREYCCVPRAIAHQRGCYIGDEKEFTQDAYSAAEARKVVGVVKKMNLEDKKADYKEAYEIAQRERSKVEVARADMEKAGERLRTFSNAAARSAQDRVSNLTVVKNAVDEYSAYCQELVKTKTAIEHDKTAHKEVSADLAAIRKAAKGRYGINDCFAQVIQYILGTEVVGKVVETGGDIVLDTKFHDAAIDSTALNEVQTVAFDLSVLTLSIQGDATHPRFLVHDGPRVSDLTVGIYHRYFDYAKYLENRAGGNPNFQYIITTTTPPRDEFKTEEYLRLMLESSDPEKRLLKCDLNYL